MVLLLTGASVSFAVGQWWWPVEMGCAAGMKSYFCHGRVVLFTGWFHRCIRLEPDCVKFIGWSIESDKITLLKIKCNQENCQQKDTPLILKQMSRRMIDLPRCCFIPFIGWKFDASMHTSVRCIGEINRWIKQRSPCDAMQKCSLCCHVVSVCLYVCLSVCHVRGCCQNRVTVSSQFFHHALATPFSFFRTKRHNSIPTGIPLTVGWRRMQVG